MISVYKFSEKAHEHRKEKSTEVEMNGIWMMNLNYQQNDNVTLTFIDHAQNRITIHFDSDTADMLMTMLDSELDDREFAEDSWEEEE